jgi:LPXTG-site transpeptidase (sortase) family protein
MDGKYSKVLTIVLIIAIIIILFILGFLGFNIIRNNNLRIDAEVGADTFIENAKNKNKNNNDNKNETKSNSVSTNTVDPVLGIENLIVGNTISDSISNKQTYKGFPQVGVIEIPKTKLKCPILEDASKAAIEVAVGIYEGVGLNKVGNTTIAGHNYRNGTFFSDNKKIEVGDKIYITDESGTKVTYIAYNIVTVAPEDSSYFGRDTEGKREITLDTCTDDTQSRLLVLAREE